MTRLLRLGEPGDEVPAIDAGHGIRDLRPLTHEIDAAFLADDGVRRARDAVGDLPLLDGAERMRVGSPIARPGAVLCIGQNYAAHAAESGSAPPENPILFFKHPASVVGPFDDIRMPAEATTLDWEVELGVVIARTAWRLGDDEDPLSYVAGYTVGNDVSERTWQRQLSGGQWSKGKTAPTFCPTGPELVPADEIDPQALRVWSRVNGERRQDSTTADMVFPVAALVRDLSHYVALQPGDLLLTGTPEGVAMSGRFPYLAVGDVLELGVDGLGAQRSTIAAG